MRAPARIRRRRRDKSSRKCWANPGRSFAITVVSGRAIERVAQEKAASGCEILVAGGGDGTICRVAEAALPAGKTLGIVPLGTFNYFAHNLGIPLAVEAAARVILDGQPVRAPVFDLNGRLVLNNVSIGIHPAVLWRRRRLYRRWGRNQISAYLSVRPDRLPAGAAVARPSCDWEW